MLEVNATRVVNIRDYRVIISGTWRIRFPSDVVRVDRRTPYGNPYEIGAPDPDTGMPMSRDRVVYLYRGWLGDMLATHPDFLAPLKGKRLACWCSPDEEGNIVPCHAFVIAEFLEKA